MFLSPPPLLPSVPSFSHSTLSHSHAQWLPLYASLALRTHTHTHTHTVCSRSTPSHDVPLIVSVYIPSRYYTSFLRVPSAIYFVPLNSPFYDPLRRFKGVGVGQKSVQIDQNPPGRIHRGTDRGAGISSSAAQCMADVKFRLNVPVSCYCLRRRRRRKTGENRIMKALITSTAHEMLLERVRWVEHVACMQDMEGQILTQTDQLEFTGLLRRIILKRMFSKQWDAVGTTGFF